MQLDNLGNILLVGFILLCVLPLIIVIIAGFLIFRAGQKRVEEYASADAAKLQEEYQKLRAQNPNASTEQLVGKIIHKQAVKCGVVGAITGIGGFITLPIGLPVDIILSLRLQAAMVDLIAAVYGHANDSEAEAKIRTFLIMSAGGEISQRATGAVMKFLLRVIGKSFSKLIPFFGAMISFAVDYAICQAVGRVAARRYASQ